VAASLSMLSAQRADDHPSAAAKGQGHRRARDKMVS
jgi:hypothetical protein